MICHSNASKPLLCVIRTLALVLLLVLVLQGGASAQAREPEGMWIQNVVMFDPYSETEDIIVNILIKDEKLELVTRNAVPADDTRQAFDARQGFLLGRLSLGEPPSFVILDTDPRVDVQILLDTGVHIRFAMQKGVIVRNRLQPALIVDKQLEETGWFAYSPPPISLPVSYTSSSSWNRWKGKYVSGLLFGILALDRGYWFAQDDASEQQVGDLTSYEGGVIRDIRLGLIGTFNFENPWVYTVFAASHSFDKGYESGQGKDFSFYDWRLDIPLYKSTALSLGKQKEPISMERIAGMAYHPMQERSAPNDAFMAGRNVGAILSGTAFNMRTSWAAGVFNNWFDEGESFDESATQYAGRLTWLPYLRKKEGALFHLGLGLRYTDGKEGVTYSARPEFGQAPVFVDTGLMDADGAVTYDLEAAFRMGPVWLGGEYISNRVDAPELGDPVLDGYEITASWVITGEMRPYNRRNGTIGRYPVAKSVYHGGPGAWESVLRWSSLDLTDGDVNGGKMDILSLGVNWWLSSYFLTNINYRHIILDHDDLRGRSDGLNVRVALILE